jgi:hypothetical protein
VQRWYALVLFAVVAVLLAISLVANPPAAARVPDESSTSAGPNTSRACPITQAPDPAFEPPAPYPAKAPYAGEFWYGTPALWTMLGDEGTWQQLPHTDAGYTQKVFWWRQGYDWRAEPEPELTVTGRRLDGSAPPLSASRATNAYHPDFSSAMLVGVDVPTLGCWEITGHIDGQALSFVVWVAP